MDRNAESERRQGDMIRFGKIAEVLAGARVKIDLGGVLTPPVRFSTGRAGKTRKWSRPSIGEQVIVVCPEGEAPAAVPIGALFCDLFPAPTDEDVEFVEFEDGCVLEYDPSAHELRVALPAGGRVVLVAPAGVDVEGDVRIVGAVEVTGGIRATDVIRSDVDVVADTVKLKTHKHGQVSAGQAQSGAPV